MRRGADRLPAASVRWLAAAMAWAVIVIVLAAFLPIETVETDRPGVQPRYSPFHMHGVDALLLAAVPLAVACSVFGLLALRRNLAYLAAWTLAGIVCVGAFVGFVTFLIGIFVMPVGVFLALGCSFADNGR